MAITGQIEFSSTFLILGAKLTYFNFFYIKGANYDFNSGLFVENSALSISYPLKISILWLVKTGDIFRGYYNIFTSPIIEGAPEGFSEPTRLFEIEKFF
jgi:hypothetical protein